MGESGNSEDAKRSSRGLDLEPSAAGVSDGYPPASNDFHVAQRTPSSGVQASSGAEPGAEQEAEPDLEGESNPEYVREMLDKWLGPVEALDDEIQGRNEAASLDPAGGWAPGIELAETDDLPSPPQPTYRQVGVRLNRGARAILDEHRREGLLSPPPRSESGA